MTLTTSLQSEQHQANEFKQQLEDRGAELENSQKEVIISLSYPLAALFKLISPRANWLSL